MDSAEHEAGVANLRLSTPSSSLLCMLPFKLLPLRPKYSTRGNADSRNESRAPLVTDRPEASSYTAIPEYIDQEFIPTTTSLLESSRFRVLVVGKSGIGKSSLINAAFGVDFSETSDRYAGKHDVTLEIKSDLNDRLILHDSEGFGFGEVNTLRTVQDFVRKRSSKSIPLNDRLHAIWLCAEIPHAGGRVFERGDEEFLRDHTHNVPIIVVFTKYDLFVTTKMKELASQIDPRSFGRDRHKYDNHIKELANKAATKAMVHLCEIPLRSVVPDNSRLAWTKVSTRPKYQKTIEDLIEVTLNSIRGPIAEAARSSKSKATDNAAADSKDINVERLLLAVAQRGSAETSIKACIEVGRHKYWRGVFSGVFVGLPLDKCLRTIHYDIIAVWNFHDPGKYLMSTEFLSLMTHVVRDLKDEVSTAPLASPNDQIRLIVTTAVSATAAFLPAAPVILPVAGTLILASWAIGSYNKTPNSLRCLMGYIIGLTMMMRSLFAIIRFRQKTGPITRAILNLLLIQYSQSSHKRLIHCEIRGYVNKTTLATFRPKGAIDEISRIVGVDGYHKLDKKAMEAAESLKEGDDEEWITTDRL